MVRYLFIPAGVSQLVENGESIKVHKIHAGLIAQNSGTVDIYERDGSTLIAQIQLRTATQRVNDFAIETEFVAANGIKITTLVTAFCTIYYSNGGA